MQETVAKSPSSSLRSRGFGNAYLLLVMTMVFWAGNTVVGRGIAGTVPPLTLAWLRWTLAASIIIPIAWPYLRRDLPVIRANWRIIALLGTLGAAIFVSLYYIGLSKTTALNGLIINSAVPLLIPIAVFVLYREMLTAFQAGGIFFSSIGVLLVITKGDLSVLATLALNEGDLWVLSAMCAFASYTALLRKQPAMHWLSFASCAFTVAAIVLFPFFLGEMYFGATIKPTLSAFLAVAYVGTLPSVVAQIFYIRGVELIGSSRAGTFIHLVPLFGAVLAILFLGEKLYLYHLLSFALILLGVWMAQRQKRPVRPTPAQ